MRLNPKNHLIFILVEFVCMLRCLISVITVARGCAAAACHRNAHAPSPRAPAARKVSSRNAQRHAHILDGSRLGASGAERGLMLGGQGPITGARNNRDPNCAAHASRAGGADACAAALRAEDLSVRRTGA